MFPILNDRDFLERNIMIEKIKKSWSKATKSAQKCNANKKIRPKLFQYHVRNDIKAAYFAIYFTFCKNRKHRKNRFEKKIDFSIRSCNTKSPVKEG